MESAKFTRTIEDFTCDQCGREVKGNGYTNHCPLCLWSRHVDVNPGDRASACGGMMGPVWAGKDGNKEMILHRCVRCGFERRKELVAGDNFDEFVKISTRVK